MRRLLLLTPVLLLACGDSRPAADSIDRAPAEQTLGDSAPPPDSAAAIDTDSALALLEAAFADLAASRAGLVERFGRPDSLEADTVTNLHTSHTDTTVVMRWQGLEARIYHVTSDGRDLPYDITVARPDVEMPLGIRVGALRQLLVSRLGEPSKPSLDGDQEVLQYRAGEYELGGVLTFVLRRGLVQSIRWEPYID